MRTPGNKKKQQKYNHENKEHEWFRMEKTRRDEENKNLRKIRLNTL